MEQGLPQKCRDKGAEASDRGLNWLINGVFARDFAKFPPTRTEKFPPTGN